MLELDVIRAAAERARPFVRRTPLLPLEGSGAWLKLELLQPTGSFKVRGFAAAALALPPQRRARGLKTFSAGNAAAACAYVAHRLGVACRVLMLEEAPAAKVEAVRRWGGRPELLPRDRLLAWAAERGWEREPEAFIHPFADPAVQAGHGGLALELLEELPEVRRVLVPVGGGGLVAGVAAALRARMPPAEVVGVQAGGYPLWPRTLAEGAPPLLIPATIADGTAAPYDAGMHALVASGVDRWLVVSEARLRSAVVELANRGHVVAEASGALAYAALEQLPPGPPTVAVVSGGNIDPRQLSELLIG